MRNDPPYSFTLVVVRIVAGVVFIVVGLAGLVLPVVQGLLCLAVGALLLSPYIPFFRRIKVRLYRKFPRIRRALESGRKRIKAWMGKNRYIELQPPSKRK